MYTKWLTHVCSISMQPKSFLFVNIRKRLRISWTALWPLDGKSFWHSEPRTGILFKTPYYTAARFRPIMSNRLTLISCPLYPIPMVFSCHRTSGCWICSVRLSIWAYIWLWKTSRMNRCVLWTVRHLRKKSGMISSVTAGSGRTICQPEGKRPLFLWPRKCFEMRFIIMRFSQRMIPRHFLNWKKAACCSKATMPEDICTAMMYLKSWLSVIFLLNATGMVPWMSSFLPISTLLSASESYFADGWLILPLFQRIRSLFSTFSTANR